MTSTELVEDGVFDDHLIDHPSTRWYLDDEFNLYIVPPVFSDLDVYGADEGIVAKLSMFRTLYERTPTPEEGERFGLIHVEHRYRMCNPVDGYKTK